MREMNYGPRPGAALLAAVGMAAALLAGAAVYAAPTVDLRGYGKVQATITPERSEFVCESAEKADLLLGKLLADLFWDAGGEHTVSTVKLGGRDALVHIWPPYGAMIAGRSGTRVVVVGGADQAEAVARAAKEPVLTAADAVFAPVKPYPVCLDSYDLRSVNCGHIGGWNNFRYSEGIDFIKKFMTGGVFSGVVFCRSSAEGVDTADSWLDLDLHTMEKQGQTYYLATSTGEWPDWAFTKGPGFREEGSPVHFSGPLGAEAFGMSSDQRRATSLHYFGDAVRRAMKSPALSAYELYCGDYIYETFFITMQQGHYGCAPVGLAAWRGWLRSQYSLAELGQRWYGDAGHFRSWDEVNLPDPDVFFGYLNNDCFRVNDGWFWKKAEGTELTKPASDAPGWTPVKMPPSQEMACLPPAPAYWRVSFDPSKWLAAHAGQDVFLVCNPDIAGWNQANVWLNGVNLGEHTSKVDPYFGPFALKLTKLLPAGPNELVLQVPQGGLLLGPTFLTTTFPRGYPYFGKERNAQYVDCLNWRLDALNFKIADVMNYARSLDPDRPFVLPASGEANKDGQGMSLRCNGGSMQDTGYESSFRPYNSRLGYAAGFYGSVEQAGDGMASVDVIQALTWHTRRLGWMLYNAEGMYKEFGEASLYFKMEKETGWFTKHHREYEMFGKYLPAKPELAILDDCESVLLGPGGDWDLGRGDVENSHYDNVYLTESMVEAGLADDYKVLYDENNHYLSPQTLAAILRYVEQGGTFLALQDTGRNSLLAPDTWTISDLTGFKVLSTGKKGTITFEKSLPIFKSWEGKQFAGEGNSLNWKDDQSAVHVSVALAPQAAGTVALAQWEDGTVAVGMRQLGKGRVLVLGSTFWRYGKDIGNGMWRTDHVEPVFLERLFTDLGVARTANATTPDVWTRKLITKNGLQEWLVAFNTYGKESTADISMAVEQKPAQMWDMAAPGGAGTKTPVEFTYADGWVTIKHVTLPPYGTAIYGVQRAGLAGGLDAWWLEKTKFWTRRAPLTPDVEPKTDPHNPPTLSFENWRFLADQDGSVSKTDDWTAPAFADGTAFADKTWRSADNEPWNTQFEDLKDYSGVGLYRSRPFAVPAGWKGRQVNLHVDGWYTAVSTAITVYLNGQELPTFPRPHLVEDVTDLLKPAGNVLCVKLTGRKTGADFPLSGLLGVTLWLQPERALAPTISLLGPWQSYQGDWTTSEPVTLPGTDRKLTDDGNMKKGITPVLTNHLVREVDIPAAWRGKQVYVHAVSPQLNTTRPIITLGLTSGMLMINGQAIPFDTRPNVPLDQLLNVTQYLKFGAPNRFEIWPREAAHGSMTEVYLVVNDLVLGCGKE